MPSPGNFTVVVTATTDNQIVPFNTTLTATPTPSGIYYYSWYNGSTRMGELATLTTSIRVPGQQTFSVRVYDSEGNYVNSGKVITGIAPVPPVVPAQTVVVARHNSLVAFEATATSSADYQIITPEGHAPFVLKKYVIGNKLYHEAIWRAFKTPQNVIVFLISLRDENNLFYETWIDAVLINEYYNTTSGKYYTRTHLTGEAPPYNAYTTSTILDIYDSYTVIRSSALEAEMSGNLVNKIINSSITVGTSKKPLDLYTYTYLQDGITLKYVSEEIDIVYRKSQTVGETTKYHYLVFLKGTVSRNGVSSIVGAWTHSLSLTQFYSAVKAQIDESQDFGYQQTVIHTPPDIEAKIEDEQEGGGD